MEPKFLSEQAILRLLEFKKKGVPLPPQIRELEAQIESETRAAEVKASFSGGLDKSAVSKIVDLKIERDRLFCDWAEGKLDNSGAS